MINSILAYLGGYMTKFKIIKWNGYEVRLLPDKDDIRRNINLIPYFWDDDINYTAVARCEKNTKHRDDIWRYKWRLLDLDGNRIKQSEGSMDITIPNLARKIFGSWAYGKRRAIVLGNLSPHKNYVLKVTFTNGNGESVDEIMATFSTKDRGDFYSQIFLIIFSVAMATLFAILGKGCGL